MAELDPSPWEDAGPADGEQPTVTEGPEGPEGEAGEATKMALGFPDRREERNRCGLIRFKLENGVPDVGGLGWRSRAGHLLKNQTFFASRPGENQWNNPTHAGPRTWRSYHGPKLRTDADLMERMDRVEAYHAVWEAKKAFVNTVRMQTLDRFYNRKIENEQKEMASTWAPHRRARGEYHKYHETMASNLDSMPMKELKKVLTPTVLHGDREAIRAITKRVQTEETWKVAWKEMELARRAETQADLEHRMTYNAMLMELAGQAPRANNPRKPRKCSNRVSDLARPAKPKTPDDITKRSDTRAWCMWITAMPWRPASPGLAMPSPPPLQQMPRSAASRPSRPRSHRQRQRFQRRANSPLIAGVW